MSIPSVALCSLHTLCNGHGYLPMAVWRNSPAAETCSDRLSSEAEQTQAHPPGQPLIRTIFIHMIGHSAKSHSCLVENLAFLIRNNNFSIFFFHLVFLCNSFSVFCFIPSFLLSDFLAMKFLPDLAIICQMA